LFTTEVLIDWLEGGVCALRGDRRSIHDGVQSAPQMQPSPNPLCSLKAVSLDRHFKLRDNALFLFHLAVVTHLLVHGDETLVAFQGIRSERYCMPEARSASGQRKSE